MQNIRSKLAILALLLVTLFGCQFSGNKTQVDDLPQLETALQNKQIDIAIHLLEQGKVDEAKTVIEDILAVNPKHKNALLLLKQLNLSTQELFNTRQNIQYQIKRGDSLGKLAEKWLGNSLYFVTLAKHNNIAIPLNMQPGLIINIPVTNQSKAVKNTIKRSLENLQLLDKYLAKQDYYLGLRKANILFFVEKDLKSLYERNQRLLDNIAESSISISERKAMLIEVQEISRSSRDDIQRKIYRHFITKQTKELLITESLELFKQQNYFTSAEKLVESMRIDEPFEKNSGLINMQPQLLDRLHEQAVMLYRNQSLQEALSRWNLILQLHPENELAKNYTQRTQKLLKKLNQF